MSERAIAIVGASVAGVAAAVEARNAGFRGAIHLYDAQSFPPYDRPPLSKGILAGSQDLADIALMSEADWADLDVDLRLGQAVLAVDERRSVTTANDSTEYDGVILAPGTRARAAPFPVDPRISPHVLRSCDDAIALRTALGAAKDVVIVGGGFIGLEVASVAAGSGARCVVVEATDLPLGRAVGREVAEFVLARHRAAGSEFRLGVQVQRIDVTDQGRPRISLSDGTTLETDLVVLSIGVEPAVDFLEGGGIVLEDGIAVDEFGESSAERVYACGDAANAHSLLYRRRVRIEHWTTAREQGANVAGNLVAHLAGRTRSPLVHVPYVWSDQLDLKIQTVGRLPDGATVRVEGRDDHSLAVSYWLGGSLAGGAAVNRVRDVMRMRRAMDTALREMTATTQTIQEAGDGPEGEHL